MELDAAGGAGPGSSNLGQCLHLLFSPLKGTAHAARGRNDRMRKNNVFSVSPESKISVLV